MLSCRLEIIAVFDERGAESPHRSILLDAVSDRHDHGGGKPIPFCGKCDGLAVVPTSGCYHFSNSTAAGDIGEIYQATANLERANGCIIFVLYPYLNAKPLR
jgi:hypothetical protein